MGSGDLDGAGGVEFWRVEAERLAADNVVLQARVAELEGQIGALTEKVSVLTKLAFGKSSEKAAKPAPVGEDTGDPNRGPDRAEPDKRGRGQRRGSRGMAAGTTRICRAARRSTTSRRVSGSARVAARATSRSGKNAASRSTGRSG